MTPSISITEILSYVKLLNKGISDREYPRRTTGYEIQGTSVEFYNGRNQSTALVTFEKIRETLGRTK